MYPSNINGNPISYSNLDQPVPYTYRPSLYDINPPNSKQEDPPPSSNFFYFPSPYIHYEEDLVLLHDLYLQQQQQQPEAITNMADLNKINDVDGRKGEYCNNQCHSVIEEQIPRQRSSKKDRHSKINTRHGPRDRRMRLSLDVAKKFFSLQDTLGYDKASKTVEWLLNQSKSEIEELTAGLPHMKISCSGGGANSASSTSECEVVSGIDESAVEGDRKVLKTPKGKASASSTKEKKTRGLRKSPVARESREKARARARERTREKKNLHGSKLPLEAMDHDMNRLGSWSPFENGEESGTQSRNINPQLEVLHDVEELRSSIIFNYDQHNSGTSQQHQFTDFQVYGKPWEAYNSMLT